MFIFGNILLGIAKVLNMVLSIYVWIVIVAALITWVNPDPYNVIVRALRQMTEPLFRVIRRKLPVGGGIDFSPVVAVLLIYLTKWILVKTLYDLAFRLR
jgi:YggT family protein